MLCEIFCRQGARLQNLSSPTCREGNSEFLGVPCLAGSDPPWSDFTVTLRVSGRWMTLGEDAWMIELCEGSYCAPLDLGRLCGGSGSAEVDIGWPLRLCEGCRRPRECLSASCSLALPSAACGDGIAPTAAPRRGARLRARTALADRRAPSSRASQGSSRPARRPAARRCCSSWPPCSQAGAGTLAARPPSRTWGPPAPRRCASPCLPPPGWTRWSRQRPRRGSPPRGSCAPARSRPQGPLALSCWGPLPPWRLRRAAARCSTGPSRRRAAPRGTT
ncbi:unnamed protein product, partial [Prorocentrum cordatum]